MSIIARSSFSASGSGEAVFTFALYAALVRGGFGASESSSSEMMTPFLTRAGAALLGSDRLDGGFRGGPATSSSESESFNVDFLSTVGWKPSDVNKAETLQQKNKEY
jgi:hypothetical protein